MAQILEDVAGRPEEEKGETVGRAKTFYFSKYAARSYYVKDCLLRLHRITGSAISWEDVQATSSDEPRPLTFAEISELIQTGQTHLIPNNKEIPGGTNVSISEGA